MTPGITNLIALTSFLLALSTNYFGRHLGSAELCACAVADIAAGSRRFKSNGSFALIGASGFVMECGQRDTKSRYDDYGVRAGVKVFRNGQDFEARTSSRSRWIVRSRPTSDTKNRAADC